MLTIHLEKTCCNAEHRQIGPVDGLRIERKSLRVLPLNVEVLRLQGDQWRDDDNCFDALVIDALTLVYVERSRRDKGNFYGPFEHIRVMHGAIRTSADDRRTLARFNVFDSTWHIGADHTDWPTVMFLPCR
jgi:hypothetical protein